MSLAPRFDSYRQPVLGTRGMVASSQPLATAAGLRILDEGGNAADAAVATAAALNVTEPNMTGLGGDCFALYYEATSRRVSALNGSGRAPAALSLERLRADGLGDGLPPLHPHCVTVPGACAAWVDLVERHGVLPIAKLFGPAIELAERGFPVAPITAKLWSSVAKQQLTRSAGGRELLIEGRGPRAGEIFRNPTLAQTLRQIADGGAEAFYLGKIAEAIVEVVRTHGGCMQADDLAAHRSTWEEPISSEYRGVRVWECPPNGQGLAALLALNLLRGFEIRGTEPLGPQRAHLLVEALRLAFADAHYYVADPAHCAIPLAELLSESYAEERRREIDPSRINPKARRGSPQASSDTVYLCCVDAAGNACSFINSNYMAFGTGLVPLGCGFSLQNRGHNFSLDPEHPNALAPRKRPYHTIIPAMLTREHDGSLLGPFGVMGGFMQPQGHVQVVVGAVDDDLDPQAALDRPRFLLQAGAPDGPVLLEAEFPESTRRDLEARGHTIQVAEGLARIQLGRGQMIRRDPSGALWGGSDPRADGCAMALG